MAWLRMVALTLIASVAPAWAQSAETIVVVDNRTSAVASDPGNVRSRVVAALSVYPNLLPVVATDSGITQASGAVTDLLDKHNGSFGVFIDDGDISVWTRNGRFLGRTPDAETVPDVIRGTGKFARRGIDPTQPLLRDTELGRKKQPERASSGDKWWVYVIVAGAVGLGGAILLTDLLEQDRQRVEIEAP